MLSLNATTKLVIENTIFIIKSISGKDSFFLVDISAKNSISFEKAARLIKAGLKEIQNIELDPKKGAENITEITDEIIEKLPAKVLTNLIWAISEFNFPSEQEVKN